MICVKMKENMCKVMAKEDANVLMGGNRMPQFLSNVNVITTLFMLIVDVLAVLI